eukprot:CAMPEP_0118911800 /NCGR_PEP_ID=MMETSP1166-20130328/13337_1 /TAXON_ID=1104430 /ORGANISM="Chrysoreinhardia sp, Strain CCMP3193" /LENGTH=679 /DNA_ID=CAMNT_0006851307 /DNA_START=57 /DNA_END=2096 /DNA_ORIENTATION=-
MSGVKADAALFPCAEKDPMEERSTSPGRLERQVRSGLPQFDVAALREEEEEETKEESCFPSAALGAAGPSTAGPPSSSIKRELSDDSLSARCGLLTRSPQNLLLEQHHAASASQRRRMSLWDFVVVEALGERHSAGLDDSVPKAIDNFLAVPARFERFVAFGLLVSLDTFLDAVTLLPLRASIAFVAVVARVSPTKKWRFKCLRDLRFDRARGYDLMRFLTLLFCTSVLTLVPMSQTYHWIRGQNTIKLYVIIGIMEVFDRLACAFGQDALDSLYLATRRSKTWAEIRRVFLFFVVTNGVILSHSALLYVHITTLNVVVNASEDSAIVTLLISNNFSEIKAFVFKKYNAVNLFEVACSDVCERFKLCLFLSLLVLLAWSQVAFVGSGKGSGSGKKTSWTIATVASQATMVFAFELVADWLKHAFMAKFNKLDAHVYDAYADRLARDVVTGRGGGIALDHTHAVTRRLGLAVLPLAAVSTIYLGIAKNNLKRSLGLSNVTVLAIFLALLLCAFELKVLTSVVLAGVSVSRDTRARAFQLDTNRAARSVSTNDGTLLVKTTSHRSSFDDPRFLRRSDPKSPTTPSFRAILAQHQKKGLSFSQHNNTTDGATGAPLLSFGNNDDKEKDTKAPPVRRRTRSEDPPDRVVAGGDNATHSDDGDPTSIPSPVPIPIPIDRSKPQA